MNLGKIRTNCIDLPLPMRIKYSQRFIDRANTLTCPRILKTIERLEREKKEVKYCLNMVEFMYGLEFGNDEDGRYYLK